MTRTFEAGSLDEYEFPRWHYSLHFGHKGDGLGWTVEVVDGPVELAVAFWLPVAGMQTVARSRRHLPEFTARERQLILLALWKHKEKFEAERTETERTEAEDESDLVRLAQTEFFEETLEVVRKVGGDPKLPVFGAFREPT